MARRRDYKAEYQRRIARKMAQGFSRSEARGQPRAHEKGIRPKPAKLAKPRKKARKKTSLRWLCPSCGEKIHPQGNKVHFMACATKAGLTVREIAIFCHGDSALPRMYGCAMHSTANEIEAGIRKLAKAVHYDHLLLEAAGGRSSSTRTRLTAKTRLRK